jgi:hypothetical protein
LANVCKKFVKKYFFISNSFISLNSKNKTPMSRQLQTIEFIIDNDQLRSDAAYLSAVPAECTYYMANGLVVVHTITMPFYVLKHIDNEKLMAHITAAARNNKVQPAKTEVATIDAKKLPPNSVIREVRDNSGKSLGFIAIPHDGTIDGIKKVVKESERGMYEKYPEASGVQSRIGATDQNGDAGYVISPNGRNVAIAGTDEAKYILGDTSKAPSSAMLKANGC